MKQSELSQFFDYNREYIHLMLALKRLFEDVQLNCPEEFEKDTNLKFSLKYTLDNWTSWDYAMRTQIETLRKRLKEEPHDN